jgi:hypothetical protein
MNWNTEIPLWSVITGLFTALFAFGGWLLRLSSRLATAERDLADIREEIHGLRTSRDASQQLLADIRERLVRIETKLEDRR